MAAVAARGQGLIVKHRPDELQELLLPALQRFHLPGQAGPVVPEFLQKLADLVQDCRLIAA
jgi:hypothetical protein